MPNLLPHPLAAFAALALLGPALAQDEAKKSAESGEKKIAVSELPEVVRKGADEAVRALGWKVDWKEATREDSEGRKVFDIDGEDSEGREVEIEVREDGRVEGLEREVPEAEVPAEVRKTLKSHMPDFQCEAIESSYKDGKLAGYSFEGKRAGKPFEVFIDASGKLRAVDSESEESKGKGEPKDG